MNSQIAITLLKDLEQSLDDYCELNDEGKEAFHMAITALELFGISEQLPSTHSKLEKNSQKLDNENGELISRQEAIKAILGEPPEVNYPIYYAEKIRGLPSVQPEIAKRIVGKSRDGMTLWYQCDMCNEPVDVQDNYCRGCGRRLVDE